MSIWILGTSWVYLDLGVSCVYLDIGDYLCLFGSRGLLVSIWILKTSCVYLDLGD